MAKRQAVALREVWWVWIGEEPAVSVASEEAARQLLLSSGRDYSLGNSMGRSDMACAVAEIIWNEPLPDGQDYHKVVVSPSHLILHAGCVRRMIQRLTPSKLASVTNGWPAKPGVPAWWPEQYNAALNDPNTLVLRGRRSAITQLAERWPQ